MIDSKALRRLFNRVYLGGRIDECVMTFSKQATTVEAMNNEEALLLSLKEVTKVPAWGNLGFRELGKICGFLDMASELELGVEKVDDRRFIFKTENDGQTFDFLLSEPDTIVNIPDPLGVIVKIAEGSSVSIPLTANAQKWTLGFMGLLKDESVVVTFTIDKSGQAFLNGGPETGKKFSSPLGRAVPRERKRKILPPAFSVNVYGEHLKSVLQVIEFPSGEDKTAPIPTILASPDAPLVVKQDDDNMWALEPVKI